MYCSAVLNGLIDACVVHTFSQFGKTPILPPKELEKMGYTLVAYPISLLSASIKAMRSTLARLKAEEPTDDLLEGFGELKRVVGFGEYDETASKYEPE